MSEIVGQSKQFTKPYKLLQFVGQGEPLLNKNLPAMIKLAANADIAERIEIISNGALLTEDLSDRLIESGLTNLRVSLQGLNSDSYERVCGVRLDYERLRQRIAYFYRNKKPDMGLFVKVMDMALQNGEEESFSKQYESICDRYYLEIARPVYEGVDVGLENTGSTRYDREGNAHPPRVVCPFAFYTMTVWPDGDVQPCDAIYRACTLGNVHSESLSKMWNGDKLRQFRYGQLCGDKSKLCGEFCCAPDDCSKAEDVLDNDADRLMTYFKK
jgi:radical SAM protein with 4Fe4S-binding SPASM domain